MTDRTRWAVPMAAGVAALAVVAGVVLAVRGPADPQRAAAPAPPASSTPAAPSASGGSPAPDDAVVRDGDRVRVEGKIVALPGRPVRLCLGAETLPGVGAGQPPPLPAYCELGITLVGVDVDRLADRQDRGGAVWGRAEVTGVYKDRTVTVTDQRIRPTTDLERQKPLAPDLPADCRPPAGGWARGEMQARPGIDQAAHYVNAHPDVLGSLSFGYPEPTRSGAIGTQVLLIGTTGDVGEATRQIRQWYKGSLCVRKVPHSRAQMIAARRPLDAAMRDPARGLVGVGETSVDGDPRISVMVLVYDEQVRTLREQAGAGLVDVEPLLQKVG
jgi:hypothetical protein